MGKNDIQWCNDFNVYRPRSRTSCRLDAIPSKSWANSRRANSSSSINQRFVRFFKTFSPIRAPRDLLATRGLSHLSSPPPVGLPIIDTVAALDACFWNTSLPAKRNTNLHRRLFPFIPASEGGTAWPSSPRNGVSQRSISTRCNFKADVVMRAFWFRGQPSRVRPFQTRYTSSIEGGFVDRSSKEYRK